MTINGDHLWLRRNESMVNLLFNDDKTCCVLVCHTIGSNHMLVAKWENSTVSIDQEEKDVCE